MTFRQFAFNNVFRNNRVYAAYFLSSLFSVMVFFVYAIFAFHPALKAISTNVSIGLHFAEGIIYVFSFIFVLISMSAFLKSRKKEFGLMVMHGMTNMQLRRLVFLENVLLGFFATIAGIGIGLIFAKVILLAAENVLNLESLLDFYWPWQAIILTLSAFLFLFIFISFFTVSVLKGNKLIDLIKGSQAPKKEPKASLILSIVAALCITVGYVTALTVRNLQVVAAMIPVTIIVIIGTYFLFTQLSIFIVKKLKNNKKFFRKRTNLVLMADLAYRMKDNARTFFFVAIVSTVAFSAIGSLVGFRSMITNILVSERSFAIDYFSYDHNDLEEEHVQKIKEKLEPYSYQMASYVIKSVKGNKGETISIIKASDYNRLTKLGGDNKPVDLQENEFAFLQFQASMSYASDRDREKVLNVDGIDLQQKQLISTSLIHTYSDYYVVSDPVFDDLSAVKQNKFYAFQVKNWKETVDVGKTLLTDLGVENSGGHDPDGRYEFSSLAFDWYEVNQGFGAILFVGLFIGAVFFVAAGSFLYFRLYTDLSDDQQKFTAISKIGLTSKELSRILTIQLALLFFVPIIVALIHGAVALTALQHMFNYNLMKESVLVLGSFFAIQLIYFLFIRGNYIRKIKSVM